MTKAEALKAAIDLINEEIDLPGAKLWQGGDVLRIYLHNTEGFIYAEQGLLKCNFQNVKLMKKLKRLIGFISYQKDETKEPKAAVACVDESEQALQIGVRDYSGDEYGY